MKGKLKRLKIEDTSDCETCEQRHRDEWALFTSVKVRVIGAAWCQECGRSFEIVVAEKDVTGGYSET